MPSGRGFQQSFRYAGTKSMRARPGETAGVHDQAVAAIIAGDQVAEAAVFGLFDERMPFEHEVTIRGHGIPPPPIKKNELEFSVVDARRRGTWRVVHTT